MTIEEKMDFLHGLGLGILAAGGAAILMYLIKFN